MRCGSCGEVNPESARFCGACGKRLSSTVACPACGAANPPGQRFCHDCGTPFEIQDSSPLAPLPAPEGERKQVTVLFADVVGSTDLAAGMDAEAWRELMERFFALLRDGLNRFGGRIDKFTGDGVMALFGAPVAQEDHARRACSAALHLRQEMERFGAELERDHRISFTVRIGLNSGEVVAGPVGADLAVEYTAVGSMVSLAQRMESLAEPGAVRLTPATAALVSGYFEVRSLGPMAVKGFPEPLEVFDLVGPGGFRTPLEVAAARGFSRFVGREQEIATLEAALARAREGEGQLVGIVAGPGVGKSRLAHEFSERCRANGVDVFTAHALAHAQSAPFLPVLELLRAQFGITDGDDPLAARAKVAETVRALDPVLEDTLTLLWDFLGVADPDRPAPDVDPDARLRQLFAALNRLRQARSRLNPVVYLLEDLHWLDPGSATFLDNLVNGLPTARILLVVTFRSEYRPPWAHRSHYAQIPLQALGGVATKALLAGLLGPHPSVDGAAELVQARTGGNPFFIEEVIQGLVEDGTLQGRRGDYELARTLDQITIPATVQAVLAARVDRLAARDKTVLQTASVIGRQCSGRLLGRVVGLNEDELRAALGTLVDAELLHQTGGYPDEEYAFRHALTEEVAYGSQLTRTRARTHIAVAEALATLDADKLDERAALIAHHYEAGGSLLEAARWTARAAAWANFNHPVQAARQWRRVRALADQLDQTPETVELGINARLMVLGRLWRVGAAGEEGPVPYEEEAATLFAEGERFADATGQAAVKVFFLSLYAVLRYMGEFVEDGYRYSVRAVQLADETGDPELRVNARMPLAFSLYRLGRLREAAAVSEEMISLIGEDRSMARGVVVPSPYGWCRVTRAIFAAHCAAIDRELIAIEQALDLLGEEGDTESQAAGQRFWAVLADLAGADPDAAAEHAHRGFEWTEEAGGPWLRIWSREGVAISHVQRGEWRSAVAIVDEALAIARERRIGQPDMPILLAIRARAQLGLGDAASARASATEGVTLAVRCGTRFYEVQARHQLARAILADPSPGEEEAAKVELERALAIVDTLGLGVYEPHLHRTLAEYAHALGDRAGYDRELEIAHRQFQDVGAYGRAEEIVSLVKSR